MPLSSGRGNGTNDVTGHFWIGSSTLVHPLSSLHIDMLPRQVRGFPSGRGNGADDVTGPRANGAQGWGVAPGSRRGRADVRFWIFVFSLLSSLFFVLFFYSTCAEETVKPRAACRCGRR